MNAYHLELIYVLGFTTVGLVGGIIDLRTYRIPNWVTWSGFGAGIVAHVCGDGLRGLESALLASLLALLVILPFYMKRGLGAGDVKLLMAASAFAGLPHFYSIVFWSTCAGAAMAIVYALSKGYLKKALRNAMAVVGHASSAPLSPHPDINLDNPTLLRIPFGVGIAMGCLITAFGSGVRL
jgi:prepilin peptidase CpaA